MASEPMILDLNKWQVEQVLRLSGDINNYVHIPDTNMLKADNAHLHQSRGDWDTNNTTNVTLSHSDAQALFGDKSMRVLFDSATASVEIFHQPLTISADTTYSINFSVYAPETNSSDIEVTPVIRFTDTTPMTPVVTDSDGTPVTLAPGEWVEFSHTATSGQDDDNGRALLLLKGSSGNDIGAGNEVYVDRVMFRQGEDAFFVPSMRITGDIDVRARVNTLSTGAEQDFLSGWSNTSWRFSYEFNANTKKLCFTSGGILDAVSTEEIDLLSDAVTIRATYETNGDHNFYYFNDDWIQLGETVTSVGGNLNENTGGIYVGARDSSNNNLKGSMLSVEVRDGKDGPIVASIDFTDTIQVYDDGTGEFYNDQAHNVTLAQSGNSRAELVSKNCWAFAGDNEYINLPHRADLDVTGNFESMLNILSHSPSSSSARYFVAKDPGITSDQFLLRQNSGNFVVNLSGVEEWVPMDTKVWTIASGRRENGTLYARVNGTDSGGESSSGDADSEVVLRIGRGTNSAGGTAGWLLAWYVLFSAALTVEKREELEAWEGDIESEPEWLREEAVLYINAADPVQAYQYSYNYDVINLAALAPSTLHIKQTLETTDTSITPSIDDFYVEVYPSAREVLDSSDNEHHGTAVDGVKFKEADVVFTSERAMRFDGVDDGVRWSDIDWLGPDELTIECWIKTIKTSDVQAIFSYAATDTENNEALLLMQPNGNLALYMAGANATYSTTLNDGPWHHLATTWRSSDGQAKCYVDSELKGTQTLGARSIIQGGVIYVAQEQDIVGGGLAAAQAFEGAIDNIAVYNKILTPQQIEQHYLIGWQGRYTKTFSDAEITVSEGEYDAYSFPWQILGA